MPWETAKGEGFIAPWTPRVETPAGAVQVAAATPGAHIVSGWEAFQSSKEPESPLPGGPTAQAQEQAQALARGGNGSSYDFLYPERVPTNVGGATVVQPGTDLEATPTAPTQVLKAGVPLAVGPAVSALLGGGAIAAGIGGVAALAASRIKFPWQTPEGEGFIAPWTEQRQLESGLWGQEGVAEAGGYEVAANGGQVPFGAQTLASLKYGIPVKTWTNASKNGMLPASVQFVMFSTGHIASRSLIDGQIKYWKPKKHIVISSNPRMSMISKLDRTHTRVVKRLKKMKAIK